MSRLGRAAFASKTSPGWLSPSAYVDPPGNVVDSGETQIIQRNHEPSVTAPKLRARLNVTDLGRFPLNTSYVSMAEIAGRRCGPSAAAHTTQCS